jgi:Flp pilus assembly protein TadD
MGLPLGTLLHGRYRIQARLGEGGMGSVYQVQDLTRPGVILAVKELLDDASAPPDEIALAKRRFEDEIALMRQLHHPRIPAYVADFSQGGKRYFVMQFIPGGTLEDRLLLGRAPLSERDVLAWMIDVCDALAYLHGRNPPIIIRDLKPANIMVTPRGEVYLIDLGIARTYKPGKLSNTENLGTMTYASPEHLGQTQTDARSDIYSLGATMYQLLTNREPAALETPKPGSLRQFRPALSPGTEDVVIRAMQTDPRWRFQSALAMREALLRCRGALDPVGGVSRGRPPAVNMRGARPTQVPAPRVTAVPHPASPAHPAAPGVACPRCGFVNRSTARFCSRDGVPLQPGVVPGSRAAGPNGATPLAASSPASSPTLSTPLSATTALNLQRAREAFAGARYTAALRQSEVAAAQGGAGYDAYLLMGQALAALGRSAEAVEAFGKAAMARPTVEALVLEGRAARDAGLLDTAQVAFTRARQLDPHDASLLHMLGLICLELGQIAQAEGELTAALALRPDDATSLVALGRVYAARGQWQEARQSYERALALDPRNPDARGLLAHVPADQGGKRGNAPARPS